MIRRGLILLAGLGFLTWPACAQQTSAPQLNDAQREGRRIFEQRCAVCHTPPTIVSKRYGPALFKGLVEGNEDNIRNFILEGSPGLMPGFKYGLASGEVDAIIEYLKTVNAPARPANQKQSGPVSTGE